LQLQPLHLPTPAILAADEAIGLGVVRERQLGGVRRATREQALRLMSTRQARLEPLAWSASGHERMVSGPTAASEEKTD
jgi:hypothetical protein